jgi:hypothetical protein
VAIAIVLSNFTLISGYFILELENWFNGAFTSIKSALEKSLSLLISFTGIFLVVTTTHSSLKIEGV